MIPSKRIKEIESSPKEYPRHITFKSIEDRLQAIIQYLDEEWEKNNIKSPECVCDVFINRPGGPIGWTCPKHGMRNNQ